MNKNLFTIQDHLLDQIWLMVHDMFRNSSNTMKRWQIVKLRYHHTTFRVMTSSLMDSKESFQTSMPKLFLRNTKVMMQ